MSSQSDNRFVAIGDIHGCARSVESLLEKLTPDYGKLEFVFVGDYIDRGPDSKGVVDLLVNFRQDYNCRFLRGNHEQMLLDAYDKDMLDLWLMNGGKTTLESYGAKYNELHRLEGHMDFYRETEFYYDTDDYFFVHAGIPPHMTIAQCLEDDETVHEFLWERNHLNAFETPWEKTVVFGHTPRPHPIRKDKMLGIDTGCVYESLGYGKLTAVVLPETEFIQQICLDN